ncbi:hypothetical protein PSm6_00300 [Pseudomonas solani]|uniref:Uncharacterized protein n=1 Tax=Pseudomonas solani TaxID=2731552 RepID=A0ABM7L265_9PSED|nr:hypothetical protein [Pseudomonas solani]BCD83623.1 hypothetical protein PSm6_00300 [Pseudomonas solani]
MSKHTKGPWEYKGTLFGDRNISSEYGLDGERLVSGRQHIACIPSASSKHNPDYFAMFLANAHLICAAPDLLEALEKVLATTSSADMDYFALEMANAAIAKARGES